jgi:hypothetical protein
MPCLGVVTLDTVVEISYEAPVALPCPVRSMP